MLMAPELGTQFHLSGSHYLGLLSATMSQPSVYHHSDYYSLSFLQRHPTLTDALLEDCNYNIDQVKTLIDSAQRAPSRCQISRFYIQAIATNHTTFLITNLLNPIEAQLTTVGSSWLIGRHSTCAVPIRDHSISRCHAILGRDSTHKFYVSDLQSSNGTWVNHRKLVPQQRQVLQDGDLIQFGRVVTEFFWVSHGSLQPVLQEATYS